MCRSRLQEPVAAVRVPSSDGYATGDIGRKAKAVTPPGQRTTALPHWVSSVLISTFKQFLHFYENSVNETFETRNAVLSLQHKNKLIEFS